MTRPLPVAQTLSEAAQPYVPQPLPEPGADEAAAWANFGNNAGTAPVRRERDLRERELLGMAMANPEALRVMCQLQPDEFTTVLNRDVARVLHDLAETGAPHDHVAVTAALRERDQLPPWMDPSVPMRTIDPRVYGVGSWQTVALVPDVRAPLLVREIRSLYRQDQLLEIAHRAHRGYRSGLVSDKAGRLEADMLGHVTKDLADRLVSLRPQLYPELGVDVTKAVATWETPPRSAPASSPGSLGLPKPPTASPRVQAILQGR